MRAVIARSDVVSAYGWGIDALWTGLMSGKTAVTAKNPFTGDKPGSPLGMVPDLTILPGQSRISVMLERLLFPLKGKLDPLTTLILATTVGEIEQIEQSVLQNNPQLAERASPQLLLQTIQQQLGLHGTAMVLSSACASSAAALSRAAAMIDQGTEAVLIVTADAVSEFVYAGFATLLSLCEASAKPFDADHCGLSLGDGAAWALVTREDSPLASVDSPIILGWSSTSDAIHMTAPDRAAGGLSRAITGACNMAQVDPKQIGLIAAHGTATVYNDTMEMQAFHNVVAHPTPTFSIKGGTGHTLAAAGLMQILVGCRAMELKVAPPTVGLVTPDAMAVGWVNSTSVPLGDHTILLSTNSGFGGVNTAVVLAHANRPGRKAGDHAANRAASRIDARRSGPDYQEPTTMVRATFSKDACNIEGPHGVTRLESPKLSSTKEIIDLIGISPKYLPRMTDDARGILIVASLAMRAAGWGDKSKIGIIGTGFEGWLSANENYFRDYIAQGRSMGRASLFIYTLPTSALSETAIALSMRGPTLHVHGITHACDVARLIVATGEADGMLCLFNTPGELACLAIGLAAASTNL
jgi:3-oxoacyl-[acyl-carrier-protein] synthase II